MFGEIKFRKNNKKNYFKSFTKVFTFILIASLSGGITAQYAINKDKAPKDVSGILNSNASGSGIQGIFENSISQVAQKVSPTVVGISNKEEELWNTPEGSGSGIIYKSDGFIITNYHVIEGATEIKVKLSNDNVLKAKVIGGDAISDLAVIKVEANNLPTAKFGDSSKVKVGDLSVAIGNPLGEQFSGTVTAGIISALDRKINIVNKKTGEQTIYKVIQTDAVINPGNSGGPLCNIYGEVIGINSLKINSVIGNEGTGFAISTNAAKEIINDLMTYGKVIRPAIGIYGGTAISVGNNGVEGVYVQEVVRGSGAAVAGIMPTDIITEIGGKSVKNMEQLSRILEKYKVGGRLSCKIWRGGKIKEISIVLSELKIQ
ncbi:trypsin-like peptidase domain-containing protein [Clostridium estertheticum]|nr:trypsin-like peptidase domain-containing protein [Clostridium estertheticum]MBZ9689545.1 trypsin-like peptidase domain-containing protein [Clostridium estertheticum]